MSLSRAIFLCPWLSLSLSATSSCRQAMFSLPNRGSKRRLCLENLLAVNPRSNFADWSALAPAPPRRTTNSISRQKDVLTKQSCIRAHHLDPLLGERLFPLPLILDLELGLQFSRRCQPSHLLQALSAAATSSGLASSSGFMKGGVSSPLAYNS
jgi:hypothetical protein